MSQPGPRGNFQRRMVGPNAMSPPARTRTRATPTPNGSPVPSRPRRPRAPTALPSSPAGAVPGRQLGSYTPGSGSGAPGGRGRLHPAQAYSGIETPSGHLAYCGRLILDAKAGAGGTREAAGEFRSSVRRNANLVPAERRYIERRMRRVYREMAGAYEAVSRKAAKAAKARQQADAAIASGEVRGRRRERVKSAARAYSPV